MVEGRSSRFLHRTAFPITLHCTVHSFFYCSQSFHSIPCQSHCSHCESQNSFSSQFFIVHSVLTVFFPITLFTVLLQYSKSQCSLPINCSRSIPCQTHCSQYFLSITLLVTTGSAALNRFTNDNCTERIALQ